MAAKIKIDTPITIEDMEVEANISSQEEAMNQVIDQAIDRNNKRRARMSSGNTAIERELSKNEHFVKFGVWK